MKPSLHDPFSRVLAGAEERQGAGYFWDNASRAAADQLVLQLTMEGEAFFEDRHGREMAPAGSAMLFSHRENSRYGYPPGARAPYRLRYLLFTEGGLRMLFDRLRADFGSVVRIPPEGEAMACFEEIYTLFRKRTFRDRFQESELLDRLLIALYREQVLATGSEDPIEFGSHYLRNHFRTPISVKIVSGKCGVSREHFIREFGRRHGESPGAMLRRLRLEHAKVMLSVTEMAVQEVALACGFADINTFCRAFKSRTGQTPGGFRRKH
jgi:AraC-like DNA-binding protein